MSVKYINCFGTSFTQGGGFAGRLWNLQYFPTALEPNRIYRMYKYYLGKIHSKDMKLHKKKKKCNDCDDVETSLMNDFDISQMKATVMKDYKKTKNNLDSELNSGISSIKKNVQINV